MIATAAAEVFVRKKVILYVCCIYCLLLLFVYAYCNSHPMRSAIDVQNRIKPLKTANTLPSTETTAAAGRHRHLTVWCFYYYCCCIRQVT